MTAVMLLFSASACSTSFELKNPFPKKPAPEADAASYAAAKESPQLDAVAASSSSTTQPTDIRVTALIDRQANVVTLVNPSDQSFYGVRVWINRQYVAWVNELAARRAVRLTQGRFVDSKGKPLDIRPTTIDRVELQSNGDIYRVLGPAIEPADDEKPHRGVEFTFPPKRTERAAG